MACEDQPADEVHGRRAVAGRRIRRAEGSPYAGRFREAWKALRDICSLDREIIDDMEPHPVKEGLYEVTGVCYLDLAHPLEGAPENYVELHPVLSIKKTNWFSRWLFKLGLKVK